MSEEHYNPVCEVLNSPNRKKIILTQADMKILHDLVQNPPLPTPELIEGLRRTIIEDTAENKQAIVLLWLTAQGLVHGDESPVWSC